MNYNANTDQEAVNYLKIRAKQLLKFNFKLDKIVSPENGVICAYFVKDNIIYQSIYILADYRNKRLYEKHLKHTIITSDECELESYLKYKNIDYISLNISPYNEYSIISEFYSDKCANRSGVRLMNHIDEGLYILDKINASETAKKAYCLHPIYQPDNELLNNYKNNLNTISPDTIIATIEYRYIANSYLSTRHINTIDDIKLSPLKDVNDMLIADKIQNRKDFEIYHKSTHHRSKELTEYFNNWMLKLNISEEFYQECFNYLK